MQEFKILGLRDEVAAALASFGFEGPTEIQSLAIPVLLDRKDAHISSATGSGKTFAFLGPVLSTIDSSVADIQAIIVAPTHDLSAQLFRETERLVEASGLPFKVVQAIGSIPLHRQLERLSIKPQIVIGSAGRMRDLALSGKMHLDACSWAILDEADRLFENEAIDLTGELLSALPESCARVLVSATIPERTAERSARWFRSPVKLALDSAEALKTSIEHWCFHASSRSKLDFLRRFEASVKPERCLLFASTNASIFTIAKKMEYLGFAAEVLKSDKNGDERRTAVADFASGKVRWLITTDLGARGLDVPDISHVISFDLPEEPSIYVHRAGRTGRAGKHGISVCLADLVELKRASRIAVRYGFTFMCKILESGSVHDIEPENFFALAEEEESSRKNVRLEAVRKPEPGRNRGRSMPMDRSNYAPSKTGRPPQQSRSRSDQPRPDQARRDSGRPQQRPDSDQRRNENQPGRQQHGTGLPTQHSPQGHEVSQGQPSPQHAAGNSPNGTQAGANSNNNPNSVGRQSRSSRARGPSRKPQQRPQTDQPRLQLDLIKPETEQTNQGTERRQPEAGKRRRGHQKKSGPASNPNPAPNSNPGPASE